VLKPFSSLAIGLVWLGLLTGVCWEPN